MKWYVRPFALIHKIVGAIIMAVLGSTFFLGIAGVVFGLLTLIIVVFAYAALWAVLFFVCFVVGWVMVSSIRLIDPEYAKNEKDAAEKVVSYVNGATGDLRRMAQDHM